MNNFRTRTIKEMVENNQKVRFQFYRDSQLWYRAECGFEFPVPISEAGTATFLAEDKAILFMRYIRKHLEFLRKCMDQKGNLEFTDDPSIS
jgi:RNA:NAD 2'-phosphotransferase (TPT1/KptA family)